MKTLKEVLMKPNSSLASTLKRWFKVASDYTIEEGRVLSIRTLEAGKLTKLNAKRYRIKRILEDTFAAIGREVVEMANGGKRGNPIESPTVKGLIEQAAASNQELHQLDTEIDNFKKDCDSKVKEVHKKAA